MSDDLEKWFFSGVSKRADTSHIVLTGSTNYKRDATADRDTKKEDAKKLKESGEIAAFNANSH